MKRIARSLAASLTLASLSFGLAGCSEPETIPPTPDAASKGGPAEGKGKEALEPAAESAVPPVEPTTPPAETTAPAETPPPVEAPK